MNKNAILEQKIELEKLVLEPYIPRDAMANAEEWLNGDLIKVITGPRRAGKSVFAREMLKGKKFGYVNFDDEELYSDFSYDVLMSALTEFYGKFDFLLFDEIQNLPKWELVTNKLQRRGYNLVLTGSNSNLLSQELATHLTGRHIKLQLLPFSWKEYLRAKNISTQKQTHSAEDEGNFNAAFQDYLIYGGFPEVVLKKSQAVTYLSSLFDSILLNDVIKRKNIKNSSMISRLAELLLSNFSCLVSSSSLTKKLEARSVATIENYSSFLEEAYLIQFLPRYSFKIGVSLKAPRKVYAIDNGYLMAKVSQFSGNEGRKLENLIFVELLRLGYKQGTALFYYQTRNGREVDFVLRKQANTSQLIQVVYQLNSDNVKRETKALFEAGEELKCKNLIIVCVNNLLKNKEDILGINVVLAKDFLLQEKK